MLNDTGLIIHHAYKIRTVKKTPTAYEVSGMNINYPSKTKARLNNIYEFSPYVKENTTLRRYKEDQLVNDV
jgi:N-acetylmuramoyl-L-alanine amidase CwlA